MTLQKQIAPGHFVEQSRIFGLPIQSEPDVHRRAHSLFRQVCIWRNAASAIPPYFERRVIMQ